MSHFVFYDDSPVFGGHEVITLLGLRALLERPDVRVTFLATSEKLLGELRGLSYANLSIEPLTRASSKLEALRNRLLPGPARALATHLKSLSPDLVVAVQGNIEHSSLALHAARRAQLRCTSYIPVPHSHAAMGAAAGALRDRFTGHLYRLPDSFVTITAEMERLLRERGCDRPVHIVPNGIDTERFQPSDPAAAREALALPAPPVPLLGVVGRIEFKQKQQHLLARAAAAHPALKDCHLVFAGDGPDAEALDALLAELGISHRATRLAWTDTAQLHPALSALVIPSRYEGLPLVMLEALACGTPVFGSDRDGMRDLLPEAHRFPAGDADALAGLLADFVEKGCPAADAELVRKVRAEHSLGRFAEVFTQTLLDLAKCPESS